MTLDLFVKFFYIGIKAMIYTGIAIGLIIAAFVFVHFVVTKGWADEVKAPRSWKKGDQAMSDKWGDEWLKLQKLKAKRNGNRS